jgi:uncharacterized SAM-binding protein YcdF (DUF218 family)
LSVGLSQRFIVPPTARIYRRLVLACALIAGVSLCFWLGRDWALERAGALWTVSDPVTPADAVVVLGGNFEVRPFMAAILYRQGMVQKVLVSRTDDEFRANFVVSDTSLNVAVLLKAGVAPHDIEVFGNANSNTRMEAVVLRNWAQEKGLRTLLVPTDMFNARRVRWIFAREFAGTGVQIAVPVVARPGISQNNWWRSEQALRSFRMELVKYIYYRLIY